MTDLEMTKLCAEAMEFHTEIASDGTLLTWSHWTGGWNPLRDDAQAMALVKKMELDSVITRIGWHVSHDRFLEGVYSKDLNRAIVECVAKMQAAKNG